MHVDFTNKYSIRVATEGILSSIGDAIKRFFAWIWKTIKNIFTAISRFFRRIFSKDSSMSYDKMKAKEEKVKTKQEETSKKAQQVTEQIKEQPTTTSDSSMDNTEKKSTDVSSDVFLKVSPLLIEADNLVHIDKIMSMSIKDVYETQDLYGKKAQTLAKVISILQSKDPDRANRLQTYIDKLNKIKENYQQKPRLGCLTLKAYVLWIKYITQIIDEGIISLITTPSLLSDYINDNDNATFVHRKHEIAFMNKNIDENINNMTTITQFEWNSYINVDTLKEYVTLQTSKELLQITTTLEYDKRIEHTTNEIMDKLSKHFDIKQKDVYERFLTIKTMLTESINRINFLLKSVFNSTHHIKRFHDEIFNVLCADSYEQANIKLFDNKA
jgi:hypothetical protein